MRSYFLKLVFLLALCIIASDNYFGIYHSSFSQTGYAFAATKPYPALRIAQGGSPFASLRTNAERSRMHSKDGKRPSTLLGTSPEFIEGRQRTQGYGWSLAAQYSLAGARDFRREYLGEAEVQFQANSGLPGGEIDSFRRVKELSRERSQIIWLEGSKKYKDLMNLAKQYLSFSSLDYIFRKLIPKDTKIQMLISKAIPFPVPEIDAVMAYNIVISKEDDIGYYRRLYGKDLQEGFLIVLSPLFFDKSSEFQLTVLGHELWHMAQNSIAGYRELYDKFMKLGEEIIRIEDSLGSSSRFLSDVEISLEEAFLHRFMIAQDYVSVIENEIKVDWKEGELALNGLASREKIELERLFLAFYIEYFLAFDLENRQTVLKDEWIKRFSDSRLLGPGRVQRLMSADGPMGKLKELLLNSEIPPAIELQSIFQDWM